MGYLDIYFSLFASVSICMLIGVCIDDSVVLIQFYSTHRDTYENQTFALRKSLNEVGMVIIKTTIIIVFGVSVLLFSSFIEVRQNSGLLIGTFLFATMMTLFVLPIIIKVKKEVHISEK